MKINTVKNITIIILCLAANSCAPNYSTGSRIGIVTKLSYKGLIFSSWEGEMNVGGMREEDGKFVPNVFKFNVEPHVVDSVKEAMRSGNKVELVYRQWAFSPPTIESDYVVIEVKQAK